MIYWTRAKCIEPRAGACYRAPPLHTEEILAAKKKNLRRV